MSVLNPNAASRVPSFKPLNTPQATTAASRSAASVKAAAAQGDSPSEFSRLLVRNQNAAAVSQRSASAADKPPSQHRPVSPAPTPRAEPARSSPPDHPRAAATEAVADVADDAAANTTGSASRAQSAQRLATAESKAIVSLDAGPVDAAPADPIAADPTELKDRAAAVAAPLASTVVDLASIAVWGALPMSQVTPPGPAAAGEIAGAGQAAALVSGSTAPLERPLDAPTAAPLTAEALRANESSDSLLAPMAESATRLPIDKAAIAIDAGLAAANAPDPLPDATLAALATLSGGVRPESERALRPDTDHTPASAWAIGAPGASTQPRGVEAAAPPASASVATPLTDGGFHEALGLQVSLLARNGIHQAELRLNPADMGPVSVQITMNGDQARVDFGADLAQTRQVIEAGWAELAASLREAGFTLSGGGVSEHARQRSAPHKQSAQTPAGTDSSADLQDGAVTAVRPARPRVGAALDLYA